MDIKHLAVGLPVRVVNNKSGHGLRIDGTKYLVKSVTSGLVYLKHIGPNMENTMITWHFNPVDLEPAFDSRADKAEWYEALAKDERTTAESAEGKAKRYTAYADSLRNYASDEEELTAVVDNMMAGSLSAAAIRDRLEAIFSARTERI